jgi:hypothetical protein
LSRATGLFDKTIRASDLYSCASGRIKTNGVMFVNSGGTGQTSGVLMQILLKAHYLHCTLWLHQLGFMINKEIS